MPQNNILRQSAITATNEESTVYSNNEANSTITVIGLQVSNILNTSISVDLLLNGYYFARNVLIPYGGGYQFIEAGSRLVMNQDAVLTVVGDKEDCADVIMSYMQQVEV